MITLDDLVQHVQGMMEDANCEGECDNHGVCNLVKMGTDMVCPDCLAEYVHNTLHELDTRFNILAGAEEDVSVPTGP